MSSFSFYIPMAVPCSFQSRLCLPVKLASPPSIRGSCVVLQRWNDIKWEKAGKNKCKRVMWLKKLGGYNSSRSRRLMINSSLNTGQSEPAKQKFHVASPLAFYSFFRPYTCIGTVLGIMSSSLMALETLNDISLPFYIGIMQSVVVLVCVNGYCSGINQIFDLEIDKINKPYLPLASGEISYAMGIAITSALALMAFGIACVVGSKPLFCAMLSYLTLGSAYSVDLPFLRWKRSAVAAAITMIVGRALVILPGAYLHMQTFIFRRYANFPISMIFGIVMQSFIIVVVSLFKDIPDIEGDIKVGVNSLASRLGKKKVFWICIYIFEMAYAVAVVFGATAASPWSKIITVVSHTVLATALWKRANSINLSSEDEIKSFYMLIWKLMYIEYLLIPLVR